jgi:hypothetical protein
MEINMNQEWLDKAMELADEYARTGPHRVNMIVSRNALLSHLKTAQAAPKPLLYTRAEAAWIAEQVTDAATPVQAAPIEPEPAKELREAFLNFLADGEWFYAGEGEANAWGVRGTLNLDTLAQAFGFTHADDALRHIEQEAQEPRKFTLTGRALDRAREAVAKNKAATPPLQPAAQTPTRDER